MQKWAIVTGAGTGIGRALSIELANKRNFHILAVGRRLSKLRETRANNPEKIHIIGADVSREEDREKIARALPQNIHLQFLIHNAAVLEPVKPLSEISLEEWRGHFAVNLEAPVFLTQKLLPRLKKGSRILHISSGAARHAYAGWGAYCSSKAALYMVYQVLNQELNEKGIFVGSVRPGVVDTPMQNQLRKTKREVFPAIDRFLQLKEEGKLIPPEKVAEFIADVLIKTDDREFSEQEWDYREQFQRFAENGS
ncbi:MAG: SDR family NAD(P)-dependent oxidoreductase [Calditrichaeota bacterium]|nr:SDR family NAD(P)-dependent oxidoreductase [Calditrichota bacterium]